jgi:hypothetical protein
VSGARSSLVTVRLALAFLGFSAVVTEIATLVARGVFVPANFFSYFTIESNVLAVASLVLGALAAATRTRSTGLEVFRGAVALYMTTVALVFIVLLSNRPANELTAVPWDNTVLHYLMPAAVLLDWVLSGRSAAVPYRRALLWLAVPAAYLVYSLVRGRVVGWYPYPFLDPATAGYAGVALTSAVVAAVLAAVTWVVARAPGWVPGTRS